MKIKPQQKTREFSRLPDYDPVSTVNLENALEQFHHYPVPQSLSPDVIRSIRDLAGAAGVSSESDILDDLKTAFENVREKRKNGNHSRIGTAAVVDACCVAIQSSVRPTTLRGYRDTWRAFAKRHPELPDSPEVIEADLQRFSNRQTALNHYRRLSILYKFAEERGVAADIMPRVKKPKFTPEVKISLTVEQFRRVLESCRDDRELALVHLWCGHALRSEESLRLDVGDISDGSMSVHGKTANEIYPLLPETKAIIARLTTGRGPGEPVFITRRGRLSTRMSYILALQILARAGITQKGVARHVFRHTFATLSTEHGLDEISCRRLMRHSSRSQTEHYVHLSLDALRRKLELFSPLRLVNGDKAAIADNPQDSVICALGG